MKLEQSFEVDAPLERVWQTLIDVEHVAPCLPGAAVTGRNDDGSYNGTFTVKIGPTTASYTGKLEMEKIDEAAHTATMNAQGTDKRGQGGAKATILSRLAPADGNGTRVEVVTDYHITGRLARFGRGGMIEDISERLLREFAKRLQSSLAAQPETYAAPAAAAAAGESAAAEPAGASTESWRTAETVVRSGSQSPAAETVVSSGSQSPDAGTGAPSGPETPQPEVRELAAEAVSPPGPAPVRSDWVPPPTHDTPPAPAPAPPEPAAGEPGSAPATASTEPAAPPPPPPGAPAPEPPPAAPPPPPAAAQSPPLDNPPMPSEPMQGLSLVGSVVWGRVKRNPAPVAAAGVAVVLLMARRRRRRHGH